MADAIAYIQWSNYAEGLDGKGLFHSEPLAFSSRQERLHKVGPGERLWLDSRCPEDGQHYFVAVLTVAELAHNAADSDLGKVFGTYGACQGEGWLAFELALPSTEKQVADPNIVQQRVPCSGEGDPSCFKDVSPVAHIQSHLGILLDQ